jgi:hypothetical protein
MTMVQVYVPGGRLARVVDPSPFAPVLTTPAPQSMVDFVPPSTCELTDTVKSVSGVLWKLTVASLPSPQSALALTVTSSERPRRLNGQTCFSRAPCRASI